MAYYDGEMTDCENPAFDRDVEYKIYVNNLPFELNKRAIEELFAAYGEVTGIFRPGTAKWAYITYKTYREAEYAIRDLNNKKPLYLKVALAKERSSTREEQKSNVVFEGPKAADTADSPPIQNDVKYQSMGHDQSINAHKHAMSPMAHIHANYKSPSSVSLDVHDGNQDPYANTNRLWTRGVITVTQDGKRHVSLGRGYTLYECPDPHPKVEECILKVLEQRKNGLYEYSEDKLKNGIQSCSVCSTKTTKHCEKCRTFYCSKACQLQDWPRHQAECERIPALVEDTVNDIATLHINQDLNQTKTSPNILNKIAKSSDVKLRRPNMINTAQVENSSNMNENINVHKSNTNVTYNSANNSPRDKHSFDRHNNNVNQMSRTKMTDQPVVNATNTKELSQQHRLRKCSTDESNTDESKKNNECSSTHSTDQSRFSRNQNDSKRNSLNKEKYNSNDNIRDKTCNNAKNHPQKSNLHNDKSSACQNSKESPNKQCSNTSYNASNKLDLDFYKDTRFSKTKFITVKVIIPLDNDKYWVNRVEDEDTHMSLMKKLQEVVENSPNVQPMVGEIYGALYNDKLWYRVMVTSLNPVKVNYIDYGNDYILKKDDEIKDIGDLAKVPRFARKICLTQNTSDKYRNLQEDETMSVRMLSIDTEKTIIVEIQEESETSSSHATESASNNVVKILMPQENKVSPKKSTKAFTGQTPNILDTLADLFTLKAGSELQINGAVQIFESEQKNIYSATLTPQICCTEVGMIFNDLQDDCSEIEVTANYQPKTEELVCGKCSDGWYRGYVRPETSNSSIFSIDEARNKSVDKILPCPKKYLNICALGVMCEINHPLSELQVANTHHFKAVMKSPNQESLKIEIIINSEIIQAVVRPWRFTTNPVPQLKNGSKICLTSYRNHYHMYARSLEEDQVEYYNNVMQSVARYAQTAPHLTEPPDNCQIVIAPFEDGNSYRAMVHKAENDKAKIIYIDFGNVDEVDIKDLKVMPLCPSLQQGCAARIMLKDVPQNVPSNPEVDLYIRNILGKEMPLVCTYEGTSPKDGVRLTMLTGECVNDTINKLLVPGWKEEDNDDNTCYMIDDMKIASLGRVGDTVEALVLYVRENDLTTYMMSPSDVELVTHISDVLPALLSEYCEKMKHYIPRVKELCLALYEGAWYRAACLNPTETFTTSQILFIDYGNIEIVEHKNIRLMPKDFITPVAMANMCTVVNLAPLDSTGSYSKAVQKKLQELIQPSSTVRIKLVEFIENGYYNIELPDIRDALIKDDLV